MHGRYHETLENERRVPGKWLASSSLGNTNSSENTYKNPGSTVGQLRRLPRLAVAPLFILPVPKKKSNFFEVNKIMKHHSPCQNSAYRDILNKNKKSPRCDIMLGEAVRPKLLFFTCNGSATLCGCCGQFLEFQCDVCGSILGFHRQEPSCPIAVFNINSH